MVALVLVLCSEPLFAQQEFMELMVRKVQTFLVIVLGCVAVFQVLFVWLAARLLGVDESIVRAGLAVLLGGIMTVVAGFLAIFVVFAFPPAVQGVLLFGVGAAAGGLAIKLLLRTEFLRAMAIYLLATTANTVALALVLIALY
jgi:hypothetical protein